MPGVGSATRFAGSRKPFTPIFRMRHYLGAHEDLDPHPAAQAQALTCLLELLPPGAPARTRSTWPFRRLGYFLLSPLGGAAWQKVKTSAVQLSPTRPFQVEKRLVKVFAYSKRLGALPRRPGDRP